MKVAVVGAGISGLVAAYRLTRAGATVTTYEPGPIGGTLQTVPLAGRVVDVGAEAFIARRPEVVSLAAELGLSHRITHPTARSAAILAGGTLQRLPRPTLQGIPLDPDTVGTLVDPADLALMRAEPQRPLGWDRAADVSIGEFVAERFGASVVDNCVDPLLSGVYAARARDLGLRAVFGPLAAALDDGAPSLTAAARAVTPGAAAAGPVFGAFVGGYRDLIATLADRIALPVPRAVARVAPAGPRWAVDDDIVDAVVLAVPAAVAGGLLTDHPDLAGHLASVQTATSVVVALALAPGTVLPERSGVLVGSAEPLGAKAFTFSSQKWGWDTPVARVSYGRLGIQSSGSDSDYVARAQADLAAVLELDGCPTPVTVDAAVARWQPGLPHYAPGHLHRVRAIEDLVPPGLALAGATYHGVGVPACVAQAGRAADRVLGRPDAATAR